jgi:hypothetical protein
MAANRKRFNAFEDNTQAENTDQAFQKITPSFTQPKKADELPQVERIERLKPSQMMPDRFQPRRLLPASIRGPFYNGSINCYQAAERWLSLAHQDNGYQGTIDRLLSMGSSFEEHGQIKPITGAWISNPDGRYIFLIETGERRFWAACLQHILHKPPQESYLRVEVIQNPTRQRQVLENRHAEQPSSVSQACEVASLILAELGMQPDSNTVDEFEFFRQARLQRMPAGLWDKITPIMQLTRPRMVQLLNILQLPTPQLEMADRFRLPERVIREVLSLPADQWERMLRLSIQESLTSDDIVEITEVNLKKSQAGKAHSKFAPNPSEIAWTGIRRFSSALNDLDEIVLSQALDDVADSLVTSGRAETTLRFLEELSMLIQARLSRQ